MGRGIGGALSGVIWLAAVELRFGTTIHRDPSQPVEGTMVADWQALINDTPVRSAVRFPIRMNISLQTEEGNVQATTEDISANGLLFSGETLPAVDSRIEFTMTMPAAIMGSAADVVIHCVGRIVRHQRRIADDLAAAVIDEYVLGN